MSHLRLYDMHMIRYAAQLLAVFVVVAMAYGLFKPLPAGLRVEGTVHTVPDSSVRFFADRTYTDTVGVRHTEQEIFDEMFRMIREAHSYVLVDMFLFNDLLGSGTSSHRQLSQELTDSLIAKKKSQPEITIQVITDPVNSIYGGYDSPHIAQLRSVGIPVIVTKLSELRDSNPLFSGAWRLLIQWTPDGLPAVFPNILDSQKPKLSIRPYLAALNFKANHRKVLVADGMINGRLRMSTLVTSANPHDGSSAHSNSAVRIDEAVWRDVIESERAVAEFSGEPFVQVPEPLRTIRDIEGDVSVRLLTEGAIEDAIVARIRALSRGDTLDMAMFYLSDRDVVRAMKVADSTGAKIRVLLDPNKDAFGRKKDGVPNRQVADELLKHTTGNTSVRWCATHGEQCHSKMLIFKSGTSSVMILGSANLTRRNIGDYNLESNVLIEGKRVAAIRDAEQFFNETWSNPNGRTYSADYDVYKNESKIKTIQYQIMEGLGTSSF